MLEVKNLTKVYSTKGGVTVRALDDVSVVFPETGMVFLLGRSGSGKSTLLNVAGGLDKPDGGEVIVKGKSSKDFSGSDFDSYRNTFIGFVFQEYNILNEFTIEQNISLALQLQSKPNDKAAVAALLEQVDLAGYGKRKPNTLSGGQKQRVAIARALIKEPEIIMADEPTGALDSTTGKQVLDTLKKLSEKKLVIVVSHDREFAEQYGDRIIELKDGKILSDVSKVYHSPQDMAGEATEELPNVAMISEDTIAIRKGEDLTDDDIKKIATLLRKKGGEAIITADSHDLPGVKRACKINENGDKESFKETVPPTPVAYDGSKTKFIKSKLPLGHAIKMGASGLKSKPIRLIFTILLAVAAFILFGVVSTFMLYDPDYSVSEALKEANYPNITLNKYYTYTRESYKVDNATGEEELDYSYESEGATLFGASEVTAKDRQGLKFAGYFTFTDYIYQSEPNFNLSVKKGDSFIPVSVKSDLAGYYSVTTAKGFCDCGEAYLRGNGFTIVGAYPKNAGELMLTQYFAELFINTNDAGISTASDMIGKQVRISGGSLNSNDTYTVTGIVTTGTIPAKYDAMKDLSKISKKDQEELGSALLDYVEHGFESLVYVAPEFYEANVDHIQKDSSGVYVPSQYVQRLRFETVPSTNGIEEWDGSSVHTESNMSKFTNVVTFYGLDGKVQSTYALKDDEVYISQNRYYDMMRTFVSNTNLPYQYDPAAAAELGEDTAYRRAMDNIWSDNKAIFTAASYVDKWYAKLAAKEFMYNAAERLINNGLYEESTSFYTAFNKIRDYVNYVNAWDKDDQTVPATPTDADWNVLKTELTAQFAGAHEQLYYGMIARTQNNRMWSNALGDDTWNVIEQMIGENYSAEDFATWKAAIERWFAEMGLSTDWEEYFAAVKAENAVKTLYYCDKTGNHGSLKIVGYMEKANAEYFVTDQFISQHAMPQSNTNEYYWYEKMLTDYVRPADAKYNAIISLTNNSKDQISVALAKDEGVVYHINNNIVKELDYFLETITELGKIFLYVGLGVGVLAAFFLLNFISVSISTKRKDIGILRAVGARGSDVFKIFYAEAFIIAFICFVLASVGSYVLCFFLNRTIAETISMSLLNFGPINIALIFVISVFVSVIATFLPVYFAARKSPVDSIRAL